MAVDGGLALGRQAELAGGAGNGQVHPHEVRNVHAPRRPQRLLELAAREVTG